MERVNGSAVKTEGVSLSFTMTVYFHPFSVVYPTLEEDLKRWKTVLFSK